MADEFDTELFEDDSDDYQEFHKKIVKQRINKVSRCAKRKGHFGDKIDKIRRGGIREYQESDD